MYISWLFSFVRPLFSSSSFDPFLPFFPFLKNSLVFLLHLSISPLLPQPPFHPLIPSPFILPNPVYSSPTLFPPSFLSFPYPSSPPPFFHPSIPPSSSPSLIPRNTTKVQPNISPLPPPRCQTPFSLAIISLD